MRREPVDAPHAAVLLVRDGGEHQVARGRAARGRERSRHDRVRRREAEHVDRAAAPHPAVHELPAERVAGPAVRLDGHDVGVPHQAEARRRGVRPPHARDQGRAAGLRLHELEVQAGAVEEVRDRGRVAGLLPGAHRPVVDARVADERLQQLDGLASELLLGRQRPPGGGRGRGGRGGRCRRGGRHTVSSLCTARRPGMAATSSRVYSSCGSSRIWSAAPDSTSRPRFMTPTWSATWRTTARSWEMNR